MSTSSQLCSLAEGVICKVQEVGKLCKVKNDYIKWIKYLNRTIGILRKYIRFNVSAVNKKHFLKLESSVSLLKGFKQQFNHRKNISESKKRYLMWIDLESCFENRIRTGAIVNLSVKDPVEFFTRARRSFICEVKKELQRSLLKNNILNKLEEFQERDSGWSLYEIIQLKINFNSYTPINVGISTYIEMPKFIKNTKSVINIQNTDQYCFLWCIVAALNPCVRNSNKTSSYPHFSRILKYDGIPFPISLKDIPKFEKMNNLSINVFTLEKKEVVQVFLSQFEFLTTVNLLMLPVSSFYYPNDNSDDDDGDIQMELSKNIQNFKAFYHFALIKGLSRLLRRQTTDLNHKRFYCGRCLNHFYSQESLNKHIFTCRKMNKTKITPPSGDEKYISFSDFKNKQKVPFVIYADLETILKDYKDSNTGSIKKYQKHIPCSIANYLLCTYDNSRSKFNLYTGKDCITWFVKQLQQLAIDLNSIFSHEVPMHPLTDQQKLDFYSAQICHICESSFNEEKKVRDNCHFTGQFRGAAHVSCNLNYQQDHMIPVIFHNLSDFDAHFLILSLATEIPGAIDLLPVNKEKYISFTKYVDNTSMKFRFLDSFRFMASILDKLVSYLDNSEKLVTKSFYQNNEEFTLLSKKGIFPYDYLDSWKKLEENKLPPIKAFYSKLRNCSIKKAEYTHALNVWNNFKV
nr:unnamed protein product [Callosobruchus chinensis]